MRKNRWQWAVLCAAAGALGLGVSLASFAKAAPQTAGGSGYQLAKKVTLGGMGGWTISMPIRSRTACSFPAETT